MCDLVQSKYLTNGEFLTVMKAQAMKYGIAWGQEHEKVVTDFLAGQNVTEAKFVECFGAHQKEETDEENLLNGIQDYSVTIQPAPQRWKN
jgi:hypothetical protein